MTLDNRGENGTIIMLLSSIRITARSKAWVCGRSLLGLWVRIPPGEWMFVVSVVCCQVEKDLCVGMLFIQKSPCVCVCVCVCVCDDMQQ